MNTSIYLLTDEHYALNGVFYRKLCTADKFINRIHWVKDRYGWERAAEEVKITFLGPGFHKIPERFRGPII